MKNIRAFDIVIIIDTTGVLGQKGGFDSSGRWSVVSSHDEFLVLSRGARILRVKPSAVKVVGQFTTEVKPAINSDNQGENDGES
jgi:hypothetical protein